MSMKTNFTADTLAALDLDFIGMQIDKMYSEKVKATEPIGTKSAGKEEIERSASEESKGRVRVQREYDPSQPNDYEEVLKERQLIAEQRENEALQEDFRLKNNLVDPTNRGRETGRGEFRPILDEDGPLIDKKIFKMLEKHGWEYGKGIGAEENGIVNPLIPVKTSTHSAIIKPLHELQAYQGDLASKNLVQQSSNNPNQAVPIQLPPQGSSKAPAIKPGSVSMVYTSEAVVDDPRIQPIQEKYFRT
jgi:hypothetical protein